MFRLDDSFGFLVNRAALAMRRSFEARLSRYQLTAPQWAVLARLWVENGQSQVSISRSLFFDKPTVTGIISRLEKKGLVRKERDREDGRVFRVFLTGKGRGLEKSLPPLAAEVNKLALAGIGAKERRVLLANLARVWSNLEE